MLNENSGAADAPDAAPSIEDGRELARLYLRQQVTVQAAVALYSTLMAYVAWQRAGDPAAWVWLGGFWCALLGREIALRRDAPRVADADERFLRRFARRHTAVDGGFGLIWGLFPWLAYPGADPALDFLSVGLAMSLAAGSASSQVALRWASPAYTTCMLLTYALKAATIGGGVYGFAVVALLLGVVSHGRFARDNHFQLLESLRLRRQNLALAQRLAEEKVAVEEAARIKSLFLAGVSHDLKHPLNALGLYLGYLKARPDGLARALPGMEQALSGMGDQLSRLLELSRLESGAVQPLRQTTDLAALLAAACATATPAAAAKGLRLRRRVPPRFLVDTDPRMLQSVVDNLLSNAVRYTERGGVLVGLRRRGATWRIEVWDTGRGVPARQLPLLFDAYRRFDDRERHADQGFGLGLALARKQCELLGYRLDARSRPGRGSVFGIEPAAV